MREQKGCGSENWFAESESQNIAEKLVPPFLVFEKEDKEEQWSWQISVKSGFVFLLAWQTYSVFDPYVCSWPGAFSYWPSCNWLQPGICGYEGFPFCRGTLFSVLAFSICSSFDSSREEWVCSHCVCASYLKNPENTAEKESKAPKHEQRLYS